MRAGATVCLRLDVRLDAEPVCGQLRSGNEPCGSFSGWTELFALLESTLQQARAIAAPGPRDGDQPATDNVEAEKGTMK